MFQNCGGCLLKLLRTFRVATAFPKGLPPSPSSFPSSTLASLPTFLFLPLIFVISSNFYFSQTFTFLLFLLKRVSTSTLTASPNPTTTPELYPSSPQQYQYKQHIKNDPKPRSRHLTSSTRCSLCLRCRIPRRCSDNYGRPPFDSFQNHALGTNFKNHHDSLGYVYILFTIIFAFLFIGRAF